MNPYILTSDVRDDFLTDKTMSKADNLQVLIVRAEQYVLNKYQKKEVAGLAFGQGSYNPAVALDGYRYTDEGNPDVQEMDEGLVFALRSTIAQVVEHWVESPPKYVTELQEGAQEVSFAEDAHKLSSSVFALLRPYDTRTPWF
jgi:hypothetical protein